MALAFLKGCVLKLACFSIQVFILSEIKQKYVNAPREVRHLRPRDLGVGAIGHFGFFREKFKPLVWQETADWLRQQ